VEGRAARARATSGGRGRRDLAGLLTTGTGDAVELDAVAVDTATKNVGRAVLALGEAVGAVAVNVGAVTYARGRGEGQTRSASVVGAPRLVNRDAPVTQKLL